MTLGEMKKKVLGLIEELNPENENLTDDPDIATKHNDVINQVMFELIRIKKIAKYCEIPVRVGDIIEFSDIEKECGYEVFQIATANGVLFEPRANNTVFKIKEDGILCLDVYVYPEAITAKTKNSYEFEVSADVLEIMPYGVAADLLKSDVSAEYGNIYATRYESMKQMLDPRNAMTMVTIVGGIA